ncbi:MAG: endolytic transglycosylase MltG [Parcubacteria group bacterium]|jgi:UPF0755 protein
MNKKIGGIVLVVVIILVGLFLSKGPKESGNVVDFEIKKGENIWNTASNLKKNGIIESKIYFVWYVYTKDYRGKIKAGKYMLNSNLKVEEILMILAQGDRQEIDKSIKITFPEGFSLEQMSERLTENGYDGKKFLELSKNPQYFIDKYRFSFLDSVPIGKGLEGYLFPDTYFFSEDENMESIIAKMLDNFDNKLSEDLRNEIKNQGKTIYEIVTMASIIEKEVRTLEDKKIVSGIFYNRMKNGQAFQSCATLAFALGENKKQYSYEDTQIDSPYNTYINKGLPPGPIANPGIDSVIAAIHPIWSNYNFFLSNAETGKTVFSITLEEHNRNKDRNGL